MKGNPIYSIAKKIVDKYNLVSVRKAYGWEQRQVQYFKAYCAMIPEKRKLKQFKNLHADQKRYFIIGNGPSILQQDLTKLKDVTCPPKRSPVLMLDWNLRKGEIMVRKTYLPEQIIKMIWSQ